MRRTDKEITDRAEIDAIIRAAQVCHLAFAVDYEPYVVPLSFGYDGEALYLHTAPTGKKIACIEANSRVCFQFEHNVQLQTNPTNVCKFTFAFESVIGYGVISELTSPEDREYGLREVAKHYADIELPAESLATPNIRIWRITIDTLTAKRSRPKT